MDKQYDILVMGPVSVDHNIDYEGNERTELGGAVVASGFAAAGSGAKTAVLCKGNWQQADIRERFHGIHADLFCADSKSNCSICNKYFTADKERRLCTSLSICDPFRIEEIISIPALIYHFAGLLYGDFSEMLLETAAKKGMVALDVQCMLRHVETDGSMQFHDWKEKYKYLPLITFLKTDAAEAKILTGMNDRADAARQLYDWGAKEIMITHNTEVLVYDGRQIRTCPIKARNLSGRTGRGDTAFAGYLAARTRDGSDVEEALLYATALVSLKMENPGPFQGKRQDVEKYIADFYK